MAVTIDELQIEIQAKGAESASGIDKLTTSLGALKSMINKSLVGKLESLSSALDGIKTPITVNMDIKGMEQLKKSVQEATANIPANASNITPAVDGSAVASEMDKIKAGTEQAADGVTTITSEATRAKQELKGVGSTASDIAKLEAAAAKLGYRLKDTKDLDALRKAAKDAGHSLEKIGESAKKGASGLSKFVSSLKRILMYRVVRSILSNIAKAARDGIQNLAQYSAAIGGIDASRANATMSQFASIGLQVKNSIGAAVMPVLTALMPVIQTLANWFIIAANAVNQFFAALTGASTWSKATEGAVDYAGGLDKAAGSAKKLANATLGIDELNIISPDTGGGGGASAPDYSQMFEEIEINSKILEWADKLKGVLDEIKKLIPEETLKAFGKAFEGVVGAIVDLVSSPAFIAIAAFVADLLLVASTEVLNGVAGAIDLLNGLLNGDADTVGDAMFDIALNKLNPMSGFFSLFQKEFDKLMGDGALRQHVKDTLTEFGSSFAAGWGAIKDALKSVPGFFSNLWSDIKGVWSTVSNWFETKVTQPVVGFFKGIWTSVSGFFVSLWNDIVGIWKSVSNWFQTNVITPVSTAFNTLVTNIKTFFQNAWTSIKNIWSVVYNWFNTNVVQPVYLIFSKVTSNIKTFFEGAWTGIKSIWTSVSSWFQTKVITPVSTAFNTVTTAIGGFFTNLWTGIKTTFKSVANWFKTNVTDPIGNFFKGAINSVIDVLNALIGRLNKISVTVPDWAADLLGVAKGSTFGFNIPPIPGLAEGGFVDSGQLFIAREAGPEMVGTMGGRTAVANNDQIVSAVSAGVYEAVSAAMAGQNDDGQPIVIQLDGRTLYESNIKTGKKYGYGGFVNTAAALG